MEVFILDTRLVLCCTFPTHISNLAVKVTDYFAHLSTNCSWWPVVISQKPSSFVRHSSSVVLLQPLLLKTNPTTPLGQLTRNLVGSIEVTCRSNIAIIISIEIPRWSPWRPCWHLFFTSSPEKEGHLTRNLVGSIGMTGRSNIIKIVPIEKQRWIPWLPSWKSFFFFFFFFFSFFFCFSSWTETPIELDIGRKH